jgi:5-methylcytosine-specific restriction protein A
VDRRRRRPCRWCGGEVPNGRYTFCGEACVREWKLRTDAGYLRTQVFARDHGVCAVCGLDTEALRKGKRTLDYNARKRFEKEWGARHNLWDADHIVPVAEGGGECDLSNMRTLCLKCHRQATAELRRRLSAERAKTARGNGDAHDAMEALMPGRKAHKPRIVREPKRGSQTPGQNARDPKGRKGQYGGAGDSPLIKK